jgi:hypothetical protein
MIQRLQGDPVINGLFAGCTGAELLILPRIKTPMEGAASLQKSDAMMCTSGDNPDRKM